MMPELDPLATITRLVAQHLKIRNATKVTPEADFINDLGADSLDLLEIVMLVEDELNVSITDEAAEEVRTVQQAVDLVKRLRDA